MVITRWVPGMAIAGAVVALLATAPPARAGTYAVESCTNGSLSGWSHFNDGVWSAWWNGCGVPGNGLGASISVARGSSAGWRFKAPPDTEIAGFRLTRSYSLPANQPYGTGVATLRTDGPGQGYFESLANYGGAISAGPEARSATGLSGQTSLSASVDCGGGLECTGPGQMMLYGSVIDLRDDASPAIAGVSGSLLAAGAVKGVRTLSYSASDHGGGIRRERLAVDGAVQSDRTLDCSFVLVVPCPLSASGSLQLDTTRLPDGEHDVELALWDATLANRTSYGPFRIAVDNVPPPASLTAPRVVGSAAQGSTLYADDGAWSGAALTLARHWQRRQNGQWEDIPGADEAVYSPTAGDVGLRLRFGVRATNAEGTTEAFSAATTAVAAPPPAPPGPTVSPAAPGPVGSREPRIGVLTAAFAATGRRTITLRWGETRKVTGTLKRRDGLPLADQGLTITSRVRTLDAAPINVGSVTTDRAGRFAYRPSRGVSRTLTFAYRGHTATVTIRVIPRVTLRWAHGRLEGEVSGAPPDSRTVVDLQRLRGRNWRTFATTRLANGRFAYRPSAGVKPVRALVRTDPGWPFLTGTSAALKR